MLNRKIELQQLVKTPTATGGFTQSWVSVATLWAKIKNTSGSELLHADQLGATSFSDFTIRYRANINELMKIVYRGIDYQIRHINNIEEADLWLIVKAEKGVSQ
jgi:SPP1 family predicted phage head-tail adaptor|tara:strand:+ start:59 stop:370 length:312 start_codon:yes stop_codon:yes gene_type:complete